MRQIIRNVQYEPEPEDEPSKKFININRELYNTPSTSSAYESIHPLYDEPAPSVDPVSFPRYSSLGVEDFQSTATLADLIDTFKAFQTSLPEYSEQLFDQVIKLGGEQIASHIYEGNIAEANQVINLLEFEDKTKTQNARIEVRLKALDHLPNLSRPTFDYSQPFDFTSRISDPIEFLSPTQRQTQIPNLLREALTDAASPIADKNLQSKWFEDIKSKAFEAEAFQDVNLADQFIRERIKLPNIDSQELDQIYAKMPSSDEKFINFVDITKTIQDSLPEYSEQLFNRAIEQGGERIATHILQGDTIKANQIISHLDFEDRIKTRDARIETRLNAATHLHRSSETNFGLNKRFNLFPLSKRDTQFQQPVQVSNLLRDALQEASLPIEDITHQWKWFGDIKSKAFETGAFQDVNFADQFIRKQLTFPNIEPREINQIYESIPSSDEKLTSLINTAKAIKPYQPRYSEQLSSQAIQLGGERIAIYIKAGDKTKVDNVINRIKFDDMAKTVPARIEARLEAVSRLKRHPETPKLLKRAVEETFSLPQADNSKLALLENIKLKAFETQAFEDADLADQYIQARFKLPKFQPKESNEIYDKIPSSDEKLISIVNTAKTVKNTLPQYSEQLFDQAIELCSERIVSHTQEGDITQVNNLISSLDFGDIIRNRRAKIEARLKAAELLYNSSETISNQSKSLYSPIPHPSLKPISRTRFGKQTHISSLLREALKEAASPIADKNLQSKWFKDIKSKAFETNAFQDIDFADQFIRECIQSSDIEPREIAEIYSKSPTTDKKLTSLISVAKTPKFRKLQLSRQLFDQAIKLGGELIATYIKGNKAKVDEVIKHINLVNPIETHRARIQARLEAVSQLKNHSEIPTLLTGAVQEASFLPKENNFKLNVLQDIKSKALETAAFQDVNFTDQFIREYLTLPNIQPEELDPIYAKVPSSDEKVIILIDTARIIQESISSYSTQLFEQAIEVGSERIANYLREDNLSKASEIICYIDLDDEVETREARIKTCLRSLSHLQQHSKVPTVLKGTLQEASRLPDDSDRKFNLLEEIKAKSLEFNAFKYPGFATQFISEYTKKPNIEPSKIQEIYEIIPSTGTKLESLLDTAKLFQNSHPKYSEQFSNEAIEIGGERVAAYIRQGNPDGVNKIINCIDLGDAIKTQSSRVRTRLHAVSQLQERPKALTLLSDAVKDALLITNDNEQQLDLFKDIKSKAFEIDAFNNVDWAKEFTTEYLALPNITNSIREIEDILSSINSDYERTRILVSLVSSDKSTFNRELLRKIDTFYQEIPSSPEKLKSLVDTTIALQNIQPEYSGYLSTQAIKLSGTLAATHIRRESLKQAREVVDTLTSADVRIRAWMEVASLFSNQPKALIPLQEAVREASSLGINEALLEIEIILGQIEKPSQKIEFLFEIIPYTKQELADNKQGLAGQLALKTLKLIQDSHFSSVTERHNLKRISSLSQNLSLLEGEPTLCCELTLGLVKVAELEEAKKVIIGNKTVSEEVASKTSQIIPGFALYALNQALESNESLAYSETHAQILENIIQQLARDDLQIAREVWDQAIEATHRLAHNVNIDHQMRWDFYKRTASPINRSRTAPNTNGFGTNGSDPIAVRVVLDTDYDNFTSDKRRSFLADLAQMLRISPNEIHVLEESRGSLILILVFENATVSYDLKDKFEAHDIDIQRLEDVHGHIKSVKIISLSEAELVEVMTHFSATDKAIEIELGNLIEIEFAKSKEDATVSIVIESTGGCRQTADIKLPFDEDQLIPILKILEIEQRVSVTDKGWRRAQTWKPAQMGTLFLLKQLYDMRFVSKERQRIKDFLFWEVFDRQSIKLLFESDLWYIIWKFLTKYKDPMSDPIYWELSQIRLLREMRLLDSVSFVENYLGNLGDTIYNALTADEKIETILQDGIREAETHNRGLALQLVMDTTDTQIACQPWELINHKNGHLLLNQQLSLDLARSTYSGYPPEPLPVSLPLNILYIESRPHDLKYLSTDEFTVVKEALKGLAEKGLVHLKLLSRSRFEEEDSSLPTHLNLIDYLRVLTEHNQDNYKGCIIHFDGHGEFGRKCPNCKKIHPPHITSCDNPECKQRKLNKPQGYLYFEDEMGLSDQVSTDRLRSILNKTSIRLAVLSACSSGRIYDEDTLLSSPAPALLDLKIPAVVALQFSIRPEHVSNFMETFYKALVKSNGNVRKAMNEARRHLHLKVQDRDIPESWYVPVLYLRSKDHVGQLFYLSQQENINE